MGRTVAPVSQLLVRFESEWQRFAKAPRKVDREAFAELYAMAHYHSGPLAHAASPYSFEFFLLAMVVGVARRAEALELRGMLEFYAEHSTQASATFQAQLLAIVAALMKRLARQQQEMYTFARALRREDQHVLSLLLATAQTGMERLPERVGQPSDEMLLATLVGMMRRLLQLEKKYLVSDAVVSEEEWMKLCKT